MTATYAVSYAYVHSWGGLYFSNLCDCLPGPPVFQRATLKSWVWPGDEATSLPVDVLSANALTLKIIIGQMAKLSRNLNWRDERKYSRASLI